MAIRQILSLLNDSLEEIFCCGINLPVAERSFLQSFLHSLRNEEDIDTVSSDGKIIELLDGSVWRSLDPATSSTWLTGESVLVCNDDVMINKDENGEQVDVVRE